MPFLNITNAPKTDTTTPIGIKTPVPRVPLKIKMKEKTAMGRIEIFQCFARYEAQREPKSAGVTCSNAGAKAESGSVILCKIGKNASTQTAIITVVTIEDTAIEIVEITSPSSLVGST